MPVTPFHFGPGGLLAVAAPRSLSFLAFCASNVLIDVESAWNMITHQSRVHTTLHTYVGATFAALAVMLLFTLARRLTRRLASWPILRWRDLSFKAVAWGALLGAWTHVLFDSVMHGDIAPLAPFSDSNWLYRIVPVGILHALCLAAGAIAVIVHAIRWKSDERERAP